MPESDASAPILPETPDPDPIIRQRRLRQLDDTEWDELDELLAFRHERTRAHACPE